MLFFNCYRDLHDYINYCNCGVLGLKRLILIDIAFGLQDQEIVLVLFAFVYTILKALGLVFQSQKQLYNHKCLFFVRLSVINQNPQTA